MAASGTLVIRFIGDLKEFERSTGAIGKVLTKTGGSLTKGLTLPLVGAGAAAVKLATDFQTSMGHIEGLVGASEKQIEHYSKVILTEGPKWGKAPQELADALYFVTSSGFEGAAALDVLKVSAKASAAGLGDTVNVADLLTSAINAYGHENLTAAQAADYLTTAVKAGKLESSEMAGVLGQVLPVASAMGVKFDEAAGALAAMSLSGTNASEGATQLRGILATLLKPSVKANETLKDMGLSAEGLRQQIESKGLLSVLETLRTRFKGNDAATAAVFGNIRALTGVMNMMGPHVDATRKVFDEMQHSTGSMDSAFEHATQTTRFKFDAAMAQLKATGIQVGAVMLPMVSAALDHLSGFLSKVTQAWAGLDDGTQHVILAALGFVAAVGPILLLLGKVFAIVSALANPVGLVVTAVVLLAGAFTTLGIQTKGLEGFIASLMVPFTSGKFVSAISALGKAFVAFGATLLPTLKQVGGEIMAALGPALQSIADVIATKLVPAFQAILPVVAPVVAFLLHVFGSAVIGVIHGVADVIVGLVTVISGVFNLIAALVHGDWSAAWAALGDIVSGAVQAVWGAIQVWLNVGILGLFKQGAKLLVASWRGLWTAVKGLGESAIKGIDDLFQKGFSALGNLFVSAVKKIVSTWLNLGKSLVKDAESALANMGTAVSVGLVKIAEFFRGLPGKVLSALGDLGSTLLGKGKALVDGLLNGVKAAAKAVWSWFRGLPGKAIAAVGDLGSVLSNAGRALIQGLIDGIQEKVDDVKGLLGKVTNLIPDWKGPEDKDRKLLTPAGIAIMKGLLDGLTKGTDGVRTYLDKITNQIEKALDKRYDGKALAQHTAAVMKSLGDEFAAVRRNAKAYDQWRNDLDAARETLKAAQQEARDFADGIRDAFVSYADITRLGSRTDAEGNPVAVTTESILEDLRQRAVEANQYAGLIAQLADAGLNDASLQQLLAAGVDGGLAAAQAIAAGGAGAIEEINALTAQITQAGVDTGAKAAQEFYGAGIQAAQGLVNGLIAMEPEIDKIASRLAKKLANAIRKALKIKSPSQVFAEIGRLTAAGLVEGMLAGQRDILAASEQLAQMTVIVPTDRNGVATFTPRKPGPGEDPGTGYGGPPVHIEQNFPTNADPQAAADAAAGRIVAALGV